MSQYIPSSTTNKLDYTAEDIQLWLVSNIAAQMAIQSDEIDINEPLDSYGLDSVQAIILLKKAEKLLGFNISPMLLWHYPTIQLLAERLEEELASSESEIFQI
ncbi:acyl carrier protein [Anabaena sp. UHCC 0399]|uniref:acyl carrier protein n=1 Tax=Anabaena sp. UHCC 0399 TaxID=3110238 RepID=UPI002B220B1D|nr:acyl carrier protein [Anabaena sp. UHCC 0399]MEA5565009.1 acyl carrier protein [Anabaena sp. UHCC 0399]